MTTKYIIVKEGKVIEQDDREWIEIVAPDEKGTDKTHRIFPSQQDQQGEWVHLEKEIDMLKAKIEDGSIKGLALELTKEKKGTFWNVVGVKLVENVFKQQAMAEVTDQTMIDKNRSVMLSYAKDLAVAGKIEVGDVLRWANKFCTWLNLATKDNSTIAETIAESEISAPKMEPPKSHIDLDELMKGIKKLQDKGLKGWQDKALLIYMKTTYKVEAETIKEAAAKLDAGQAAHFVKKVQEALELA